METRKIIYEEAFAVGPEKLFAMLHTPSAICGWWRANRAIVTPFEGGTWSATWGDDPDKPDYVTVATIRNFEPPTRMVLGDYLYFAKSGPLPFKAKLVTEFSVRAAGDSAALRVEQDGFPADASADAYFAACTQGWKNTFAGLRLFIERGDRTNVISTSTLFVVADLQNSLDFYGRKLGFIDPASWGEPPCFAMLHRNGFDLMLSVAESPDRIRPNGPDGVWDMYIKVHDLEAEKAALESAGVALARPISKTEYNMIELEVVDPDGYRICFGQPL